MVFLTESWFWRGTQSAIFYYASCAPWVEYKHKRKRRREAVGAQRQRTANVVYTQPGAIRQPAPFETNEEWAQEIKAGPGPPKGWKKDPLYYKHTQTTKQEALGDVIGRDRAETTLTTSSAARSDWTTLSSPATLTIPQLPLPLPTMNDKQLVRRSDTIEGRAISAESHKPGLWLQSYDGASHDRDISPGISLTAVNSRPSPSLGGSRNLHSSDSRETNMTSSKRSSFDSSTVSVHEKAAPRPSMERRLSSAVDGLKEAMRATLHPDRWNWIRYDRDDEILSNINERMRSMWESVKGHTYAASEDVDAELKQIASKESAADSEAKRWQRGTHPAINEMHPPIVSQLPYTREEAKWMLMPPPSADVMMGRRRPDPFDDIKRQPLCIIGRPLPEQEPAPEVGMTPLSSDNDSDDEGHEDVLPGWTHIQNPQRPHLWRHRMASMP